ncbi:MAG: hypothetical protein AAB414_05180 [Patescibacteria group bacterium]
MIDLTPQITQAQIAFALLIIAGALVYLAFGKASRNIRPRKH